jgi:superfamily II DNA helicase RecQ
VIFTDATLVAIAETKPVSLAGLAAISGVGARKLEAHGAAFLPSSGARNRRVSPGTPVLQPH